MYFLNFPASFSLVSPHLSCCLCQHTRWREEGASVRVPSPFSRLSRNHTLGFLIALLGLWRLYNVFLLYIDCVCAVVWLLPVVFIGTICLRRREKQTSSPLLLQVCSLRRRSWSPVRGGQPDGGHRHLLLELRSPALPSAPGCVGSGDRAEYTLPTLLTCLLLISSLFYRCHNRGPRFMYTFPIFSIYSFS